MIVSDSPIASSGSSNSTMTACLCFSLKPPSFTTTPSSLPWLRPNPNPNPQICPVFLTKHSSVNSPTIFARVLQQGPGVVSSEDLSSQSPSPALETQEDEEGEALRVFGGVAEEDTKSEDKAPSSSTRAKKKTEEEDEFDHRFKLRNGREVRFF